MSKPVRLQLSRRKGFDLQSLSLTTNGLPAVNVTRPSKWGNPFVLGSDGDRTGVIRKYREWIAEQPELLADLHELEGKTLGCWCAPQPCHGDVLVGLLAVAPDPSGEARGR